MGQVIVYERPDGGISIVRPSGKLPIDQVLAKDVPSDAINPEIVDESTLPVKGSDRNFWVRKSGNIEVDAKKKQDFEDAQAVKEAETQAVLDKLSISKEELGMIKGIKVG